VERAAYFQQGERGWGVAEELFWKMKGKVFVSRKVGTSKVFGTKNGQVLAHRAAY
jgi:hypothetical protein